MESDAHWGGISAKKVVEKRVSNVWTENESIKQGIGKLGYKK